MYRVSSNIEKTLSHIIYSSILLDEFRHCPQSLCCDQPKGSGDGPLGSHFREMLWDAAPLGYVSGCVLRRVHWGSLSSREWRGNFRGQGFACGYFFFRREHLILHTTRKIVSLMKWQEFLRLSEKDERVSPWDNSDPHFYSGFLLCL